jgi:tRNA (guanine26-N2/guanine27-N2)-dimethyltransferase
MPPIKEHSITLNLDLPKGDVNAKMEVFYNPVMVSNRNLSILLINSLPNQNLSIADPLAGSGIRSLRFLKELKKGKIKELHLNDCKENFSPTFINNLKLNKIKKPANLYLHDQDASLFLLNNSGFDYLDIDPFGSPNPFLAAALARISRDGILAVTATDTAALTGTYPKVSRRKYWAEPLRNYLMHEIGLRILIRKVQLQGIQFDKALISVLSYHKDHYFRIYFRAEKGKELCDNLLRQHQYFLFCPNCLSFLPSPYNKRSCSCKKELQFAGPLWIGKLHDPKLIQKMKKDNPFPEEEKFLALLAEESSKDILGFYDLNEISRKLKISPPKLDLLLKRTGAVRTHFSPTGFKTEKSITDIISKFK